MKILVAGDYCPQNRVSQLFENRDYEVVLGEVKPIVEEVDYSIVNFECPVCEGDETPIAKCGPNLHCSERGVEALRWAGFSCVSLANNHFLDFGVEGVDKTLKACHEYDIDTVGGGMTLNEAAKVLYKKIGENCLAIINCCEHEFSIATNKTAGSNPLNPVQQYYEIQEARKNADHVLIIVHGGYEEFQLPSVRMQKLYRFFIDLGADAVINHHQHCFSGYEVYKNKPIFYGLGNFCFDKETKNKQWNEGILVKIEFDKDVNFSIIPFNQCSKDAKIHVLSPDNYNVKIEELNKIILNPKELSSYLEEYLKSSRKSYSNIFEKCSNRILLSMINRGILPSTISSKRRNKAYNFINCESHREKLLYCLREL